MATDNPKDFLIETVAAFFKYTDKGQAVSKDFLQFMELHIDAFERHNHEPHLKNELKTFCEDMLDLSNISSPPLRDILRKQKTWFEQNKPPSDFSSGDE